MPALVAPHHRIELFRIKIDQPRLAPLRAISLQHGIAQRGAKAVRHRDGNRRPAPASERVHPGGHLRHELSPRSVGGEIHRVVREIGNRRTGLDRRPQRLASPCLRGGSPINNGAEPAAAITSSRPRPSRCCGAMGLDLAVHQPERHSGQEDAVEKPLQNRRIAVIPDRKRRAPAPRRRAAARRRRRTPSALAGTSW